MKSKDRSYFDPKNFLAKAGDGRTIVRYHTNQTIFSQGDVADAVYYIQRGKIKITTGSRQGKEAIVGNFGPEDFFGEGCLAGQRTRTGTATGLTECVIMQIEKRAAIQVIHDQREFCELFLAYVLSRNTRIEEDLVELFHSSEEELAQVLLLLANLKKEGTPEKITSKVSQEISAEIVGTTRSLPVMSPTNEHERAIAQAVDNKYLKDSGNTRKSILREYLDVSMSLDFVMSASDSQFLVNYAQWRMTSSIAASNLK